MCALDTLGFYDVTIVQRKLWRSPCYLHVYSPLQLGKLYNWWTVLHFNEHFSVKTSLQILRQRKRSQVNKRDNNFLSSLKNKKPEKVFCDISIYTAGHTVLYSQLPQTNMWRHWWHTNRCHYFIMFRIALTTNTNRNIDDTKYLDIGFIRVYQRNEKSIHKLNLQTCLIISRSQFLEYLFKYVGEVT